MKDKGTPTSRLVPTACDLDIGCSGDLSYQREQPAFLSITSRQTVGAESGSFNLDPEAVPPCKLCETVVLQSNPQPYRIIRLSPRRMFNVEAVCESSEPGLSLTPCLHCTLNLQKCLTMTRKMIRCEEGLSRRGVT